jgi:hypothetical protein
MVGSVVYLFAGGVSIHALTIGVGGSLSIIVLSPVLAYLHARKYPGKVEELVTLLAQDVWGQDPSITEAQDHFRLFPNEFTTVHLQRLATGLQRTNEQLVSVDAQFTQLQEGGQRRQEFLNLKLDRPGHDRDYYEAHLTIHKAKRVERLYQDQISLIDKAIDIMNSKLSVSTPQMSVAECKAIIKESAER